MNLLTVIILFVIVLLLILAILLSMMKKNKSINKNDRIQKSDDSFNSKVLLYVKDIEFPPVIEKFSTGELSSITRKIYDSYRVFDYRSFDEISLGKKEWHSWQVSIILMMYKKDEEFFIPLKENIFNEFLLQSSKDDLDGFMQGILKKYLNYVDINSGKDKLSSEYIWSNRDVSIIFYFLTTYKQ